MSLWPVALAPLALLCAWPLMREWRRKPVASRKHSDPAGRFADLPRGRVFFRWHGPESGPVAVCVHGLTTPSYVWDGLIPHLTGKGFRVLSFDLYGRGYSDRPRAEQDADFFDNLLCGLLADQRVSEPFTLLGNSMGSAVSAAFAARHPARIRQLVLLVPAGMGHDLGAEARLSQRLPVIGDWLFDLTFPGALRRGTEAERHLPSSVAEIIPRQLDELAWRGFLRSVRSSMRAVLGEARHEAHRRLHALGVPTLAIWGGRDTIIPMASKDLLSRWNPDARHIVLPEAGHGLVYTDTAALWAHLDAALLTGRD